MPTVERLVKHAVVSFACPLLAFSASAVQEHVAAALVLLVAHTLHPISAVGAGCCGLQPFVDVGPFIEQCNGNQEITAMLIQEVAKIAQYLSPATGAG